MGVGRITGVLATAGALGVAGPAAWAGGAVCLVADPIWEAGHASAQGTMSAAVDAMASTFAEQSLLTHQALISAIRVHTRQTSLNAERDAVATTSNAEAAANVYVEQRAAEQMRDAHETYGPQGQMVGGCELIEDLRLADDAMEARMDRATDVLSGDAIDAAPGQAVAPLEAAARRLSEDTPTAVSAVAFFDPETTSADRDAFMNNVIGLPFPLPAGIDGVEDELVFMQARRWEAMRSPAIVSLAAVRAAAEEGSHFGVGADADETTSYLGALDWYVGQFGGGPGYAAWSASLVTKSEAGLQKEVARLRAINLLLSRYRQEGQDRQLAVIATLLAGTAVQ